MIVKRLLVEKLIEINQNYLNIAIKIYVAVESSNLMVFKLNINAFRN